MCSSARAPHARHTGHGGIGSTSLRQIAGAGRTRSTRGSRRGGAALGSGFSTRFRSLMPLPQRLGLVIECQFSTGLGLARDAQVEESRQYRAPLACHDTPQDDAGCLLRPLVSCAYCARCANVACPVRSRPHRKNSPTNNSTGSQQPTASAARAIGGCRSSASSRGIKPWRVRKIKKPPNPTSPVITAASTLSKAGENQQDANNPPTLRMNPIHRATGKNLRFLHRHSTST